MFQDLPLDLQAFPGEIHQFTDPLKVIFLRFRRVADARHVQSDHADGARQGIGSEQAASALAKLPVVQPQAAAHAPGILRFHVAVDEIGEVRDAVFGRHLQDRPNNGTVPVEFLVEVVGRNGKGEDPAFGVPFHHHLGEGAVQDVHLLLEFPVGMIGQFPTDDDGFIGERGGNRQIHGQICEWGLEANPRGHVDVEDEFLKGLFDLVVGQLVVGDEGGKVGVEIGEGLGPRRFPLQGVEEVDDLTQGWTKMTGGAAFHLSLDPFESLDQEIPQVPPAAIDGEEPKVMDMEIPADMGLANFRRVDTVQPVLGGDGGGDVVVQSLEGVTHVAVFVDAPILAHDILVHGLFHVQEHGADVSDVFVLLAVENVGLGGLGVTVFDENLFDDVLDFFDGGGEVVTEFLDEGVHHMVGKLVGKSAVDPPDGTCRFVDGVGDFFLVKPYETPVPLANLLDHADLLSR